MRIILILFILNILISCGSEKAASGERIIVDVKVERTFDTLVSFGDFESYKAIDLNLSIINKTDKAVSLWMMSCSWSDNFLFSNEMLSFSGQICDANYPVIKKIQPKDSIVFKGTALKQSAARFQSIDSISLGFIFIDSVYCKDMDEFLSILGDKRKEEKIIWSQPILSNTVK